ncbi:helix-turn-helix transcriptional regulator [Arthrobacter sp. ISL-72]|uniref:helix-turn-helix domain-containing protein n=1 Tax=Arthrobacter sp. ISL-72 TaxID=2819114 RepID=UPI00288C53B8|nr:helix-turn-helix transcriptional regulator [Arthrobacter sp. ISL-72]
MKNPHLEELGQFLKARRADLTPEDLGLTAPHAAIRRVSGLRREEVAQSVAISHDYYTRIEQGRLAPSAPSSKPSPTPCTSHRTSAPTSKDSPSKLTGAPLPGASPNRWDRRSSVSSIS